MTNYYVSQQNGNDGNSGLDADNAWETLSKVAQEIIDETIVNGNTIYVGPGIYGIDGQDPVAADGDHIWIERGGTFLNPIRFLADPDCDYLINDTPGPVRVDCAVCWDCVVEIEGFDIYSQAIDVPNEYGSIWAGCSDVENPLEPWKRRPVDCGVFPKRCSIAKRNYIDNVNVHFTNCLLGYTEAVNENIWIHCDNTLGQTIYLKIANCTSISGRLGGAYAAVKTLPTATSWITLNSVNNIFISFGDACTQTPFYNLGYYTTVQNMDYNHYEYYFGSFYGPNYVYKYKPCMTLSEWQSVTGKESHSTEGWAYLIGFSQEPDGYRIMKTSPCRDTGAVTGSFGLVPTIDIEENARFGPTTCKGCYEWQDVPETNALIYYVKKTGNDLYTGLSGSGAFRTIRAATNVVKSYDTTYIGPGKYEESLDMPPSGSWTTWIGDYTGMHTGVDAGEVIVQTFVNMVGQGHYAPLQSQHHVRVFNIHFDSAFTYVDSINASIVSYQSQGMDFRQCRADYGMYFLGSYGCLFINNVAWSSPFFGSINYNRYAFYTSDCSNIFYHNTFIHLYGKAIGAGGACFGCGCYSWIINNIMKCVLDGSGSRDPIIKGAAGFYINSVFDGNFYQYDGGDQDFAQEEGFGGWDTFPIWQNDGFDEHSFEGDPLFKSDGFHITRSSPCVDNALATWVDATGSAHTVGVHIDYDHEYRPMIEGYDIGCDEVPKVPLVNWGIGDDVFEPSQKGPTLVRNTPYREPQLKWPCTHYCSGTQHTLGTCPRCLGTGYYYDIKFDAGGLVPQVWDETKLQQELEKITLTEFNPFHPEYGAGLKKRVGQVGVDELKAIIKSDLVDAVYNLMRYQKAEANKGVQNGNFSSRELIDRLEKVEITKLSATELYFALYIITVHGKEIELTGKILV